MTVVEVTEVKTEGREGRMAPPTILLVDDEEPIRQVIPEILERQGYRVLVAPDGIRALTISGYFPHPIDLLLTDISMPHMNGKEVARCLVRQRPAVKVVYMSGYAENTLFGRDTGGHVRHFLKKPFLPETLLAKVEEALGRRAPNHEVSNHDAERKDHD